MREAQVVLPHFFAQPLHGLAESHAKYSRLMRQLLITTVLMLTAQLGYGQCELLTRPELIKLRKLSTKQRKPFLVERQGKSIFTVPGVEKDCAVYTFGRCKEFLNDRQWYWSEVVTYRECDRVLIYSTANELHFKELMTQVLRDYSQIGTRSYGGLTYTMYENEAGKLIEVNHHANEEGVTFWMTNIF